MLLEYFLKRSGRFRPPTIGCSSRSGACLTINDFSYSLEGLVFTCACSFLLGLRLLSRKWMRFGSYSLSQARKNLRIFDNSEQDKHLQISCLRLSKLFIFSRVKLQTSLYHPIPLDSKPYKQTNRLENLLLLFFRFIFVFSVCSFCFFFINV